jgi:hypothetical protein
MVNTKSIAKRQNGCKMLNVCRCYVILFLSNSSENCGLRLVSKVPLDTFSHYMSYKIIQYLVYFLVNLGHEVRLMLRRGSKSLSLAPCLVKNCCVPAAYASGNCEMNENKCSECSKVRTWNAFKKNRKTEPPPAGWGGSFYVFPLNYPNTKP